MSFFVIATLGAAAGSALFGGLVDRKGSRRVLGLILVGWVIALGGVILVSNRIVFTIIGALVGALLGGVWTASRPLLLELTPRGSEGRFFGLYSLSGKAAAIVGPLIWGGVTAILEPLGTQVAYRSAVGAMALLILAGYLVLRPLKTAAIRE